MKMIQKIVAFIGIALFTAVLSVAQENEQTKQAPPLETHYMVDFVAYHAIDPGIAFNAEWVLNPELVLAGEVGIAYAMAYGMAGLGLNSQNLFLHDEVDVRWYINRAKRASRGRTVRKNSGFYFDFGIKHMYLFCIKKQLERQFFESPYGHNYARTQIPDPTHSNVLGVSIGVGWKIVSKSNIYFSWKLGLGYGLGIETYKGSTTQVYPALLPTCNIRVGYCF